MRMSIEPQPGPRSLPDESATRLAALVARGEVDAEAVLTSHLLRIADREPSTRALVGVTRHGALRAARRLDARRRGGAELGPLAGVPVVVKDNIDVRGQVTAACSPAHQGPVATKDAEVVRRLRRAGAVLVARANMDELAMGASTQTSPHGPSLNPHDPNRSPGGSSGGCAAAVAAHEVPLAIGTDTGGSIREPAAQCGVFGMAPTPGVVPTAGVVPFAPHLDRVGPLARTAADLGVLLGVLTGRPYRPAPERVHQVADLSGLRIGVVQELSGAGNSPAVLTCFRRTVELLVRLGATVDEVSAPSVRGALSTYMSLSSAACVPVVAPYVATGLAGPEVNRRYELGVRLLAGERQELAQAFSDQERLTREIGTALAACDFLVSPTMPTTAPLLHSARSPEEIADPLTAPYTDCWTVVANLVGLPSVSVPSGRSAEDGMPVGTMLLGRAGSDFGLVRVAEALEAAGVDA